MPDAVDFPLGQRIKLWLGGTFFIAEVLIRAKPRDASIKVKLTTEEGKLVKIGWMPVVSLRKGKKIATLRVIR